MKPRLFAAALALLALAACAPAGGFSSPPAVSPSASAMLPEQSPSPDKPSGKEPPEEAAGQPGGADNSAPLSLRRWDGPVPCWGRDSSLSASRRTASSRPWTVGQMGSAGQ